QEAATALAEMVTSVTNRHNRGFKVLVTTVPPIGPASGMTGPQLATFESRRQAYNAAVLNGDSGADAVIDWHSGEVSDPTNAAYFYSGDQTHFTEALNDVAAARAMAAIRALSPASFNSGNQRSFPRGIGRGITRGVA